MLPAPGEVTGFAQLAGFVGGWGCLLPWGNRESDVVEEIPDVHETLEAGQAGLCGGEVVGREFVQGGGFALDGAGSVLP